jgi:hypothetical protein
MKRSVVIAILALLLVFAGGYGAFVFLFHFQGEEKPKVVEPVVVPPTPVEIAEPAPPDAAVAEPANAIRAAMIEGRVERRLAEDTWTAIAVGDTLEITDEIRSGPDALATFKVGEDTSVDVSENTEFGFIEISDAMSKIRLDDGRIAASSESRKIRVEVKNSDAVAEAVGGSFAVLTEGQGNVTVAANRGEVALSAKGETVKLTEGTQSTVRKNKAPARPTEIPSSLFLNVRKPRADKRLVSTVIQGKSTPGSVINIRGKRLLVGKNGTFKKRVPLAVGSKNITVTVEDATGRKQTRSVRVISPNANTKGKVEW